MIYPDTIPASVRHLLVDLDAPGSLVEVTREQDALLQVGMIVGHAYMMGTWLGRPVGAEEAARDWCGSGLASLYRRHYRVVDVTARLPHDVALRQLDRIAKCALGASCRRLPLEMRIRDARRCRSLIRRLEKRGASIGLTRAIICKMTKNSIKEVRNASSSHPVR